MECTTGDWGCEFTRIADAMSGFDWNNFASTLLATLVGASVAAAVSFWLANRERPAPVWNLETSDLADEPAKDGTGSTKVVLTNVGDGAGYNVRLSIVGSKRWAPTASVLAPGASLTTWVDSPMTGAAEYDVASGKTADTRVLDWGKPHARVEWQQPPRRTHRRSTLEALRKPKF